jgi:hypothetical protein
MRTPPVSFTRPEDLNAAIGDLAAALYHMFVDGRWLHAYDDPGELLQVYRDCARQGQACTVVAAGEIVLYSARSSSSGPSFGSRKMEKLRLDEESYR